MAENTLLADLKLLYPDENEQVLELCLRRAKDAILDHVYSMVPDARPAELNETQRSVQFEIALELVAKMGAEGEIAHSENGVSRTWADAHISPSLLARLTPYGAVF